MTDRVFACPNLRGAELLAAHTQVYAYEFADPNPPAPELAAGIPAGAYHSSDVQYLVDHTRDRLALDPQQQELSMQMIAFWTNFAHGGNPNDPDLPEWRPFLAEAADPFVLALAPGTGGIAPVDYAAEHNCEFWASYGASADHFISPRGESRIGAAERGSVGVASTAY